nr:MULTISPECIES: hypothetical protein [Caballeronia]
MAKKPDSATPTAEQETLVKGKTPRNAIMSIGILAAVVIGGLGFYYQLQATNKADEEARIKKATALKSSTETPTAANNNDIDQMIRQQRDAAASEAAARAASEAAAPKPAVKPMLTGADFKEEVAGSGTDTRELSRQAAQDAIYTSSVFKQAGASRSANQANGVLPAGVPSLDEVRAARNAAGANTPAGLDRGQQERQVLRPRRGRLRHLRRPVNRDGRPVPELPGGRRVVHGLRVLPDRTDRLPLGAVAIHGTFCPGRGRRSGRSWRSEF